MTSELTSERPDEAPRCNAAERELPRQVLQDRTVVVNVRRYAEWLDQQPCPG